MNTEEIIDAMIEALTLLEADGYSGGDVHDNLETAIEAMEERLARASRS